jgi:PAS domain S-box-containing protein
MAIVMVDGTGTIVLINAETELLFGWERGELIGQKVELLVPQRHADSHPSLRAYYLADATSRRMGLGRDLYARRKNGQEFPVEIGLNPIRTEEGRFVLAAVVDLTERKEAEDRLRVANDALVASNLELQQFTYISSHDLQEPLRSVSGFAQLLQMEYGGKLDEKADTYIDHMVRALGRMRKLIGDLRRITKMESRARPLEPTQLDDIFEAAVSLLQSSIRDGGAHDTSDKLPIVLGDAPQLTHLLASLLGNALKYVSEDPPRIHVSALFEEPFWRISIADNGIGIEANYHEMIFEVFRRVHSPRVYPGSGIGLALCRRIVRRHGGDIWVESEAGKGSVFSFTLKDGRDVGDG